MVNLNLLHDALARRGISYPLKGIKNKGFTRWGKNDRYWLIPIGDFGHAFGDFVNGISETVFSKTDKPLNKKELLKRQREIEKAEEERRATQEKEWNDAARKAKEFYEQASLRNIEDIPYLKGRGCLIVPNTLKVDRFENLIVPYYNFKHELRTVQTISPKGEKRFFSGCQKKGHFAVIGAFPSDNSTNLIFIVEGFCTGASVFTALHLHEVEACVIVAGDSGSLKPVAIEIKMLCPTSDIVLAGDNDQFRDGGNIGLIKAKEAAEAIGGAPVVVPRFSTPDGELSDWSDLLRREGVDKVYSQLNKVIPAELLVNKNKEDEADNISQVHISEPIKHVIENAISKLESPTAIKDCSSVKTYPLFKKGEKI